MSLNEQDITKREKWLQELMKSDIDIYNEILIGKRRKFPWQFFTNHVTEHDYDSCKVLVRYLIEEKLKWSREDVKEKLNRAVFIKYKLGGMLTHVFNDSPYLALDNAYPNEYKPWELRRNTKKLLE